MMTFKWIGALVILISCGSVGFQIKKAHNKEIQTMKMLISALDYMVCELQFRMYSLPELFRLTANECEGVLQKFFILLANELEDQISPDVKQCIQSVLVKVTELPPSTAESMKNLGKSMGRFDLPGQLKGLETIRGECRIKLSKLTAGSEPRLRSYQTLAICAGAAIIILLV